MAKKQDSKESTGDIRKEIKSRKITLGVNSIIKNLRLKKIEKIYLASNSSEKTRVDIEKYSKILNIPVIVLKQPNDELGLICKKQYSISTIGILKE